MSHHATTWAWEQEVGNPIRKLILLHIAQAANPDNNNETWHSISTICKACNCSRGAVYKHLKALCDSKYLTLICAGKSQHKTNRYRLNVGKISIQKGPSEPETQRSSGEQQEFQRSSGGIQRSSGGIQRSRGVHEPVIEQVKEPVSIKKNPPKDFIQNCIDAYHENLPAPNHPKVLTWDEKQKRAKNLAAIWRDYPISHEPGFWTAYFEEISNTEFLTGRKPFANGDVFFTTIEYALRRDRFVEILERGLSAAA